MFSVAGERPVRVIAQLVTIQMVHLQLICWFVFEVRCWLGLRTKNSESSLAVQILQVNQNAHQVLRIGAPNSSFSQGIILYCLVWLFCARCVIVVTRVFLFCLFVRHLWSQVWVNFKRLLKNSGVLENIRLQFMEIARLSGMWINLQGWGANFFLLSCDAKVDHVTIIDSLLSRFL